MRQRQQAEYLQLLLDTLFVTRGNMSMAAEFLDCDRTTIFRALKKANLLHKVRNNEGN